METYDKELDNSIELAKEKADKRLLILEIVIGTLCVAIMLAFMAVSYLMELEDTTKTMLVVIGIFPLLSVCPLMLRIEQTAGYYKCGKCGHRHVPTYSSVFWAAHIGWTRYMKCPECHKRSWQKKVISKKE